MGTEEESVRDLIAAQAAEYFVARQGGRVSAADDRKFLEWLRASPLHVAEYMALTLIAKDAPRAARRLNMSVEDLVADARAEQEIVPLQAAHQPGKAAHAARAFPWRHVVAGLAAASIAATVFLGAWRWGGVIDVVYATVHGEQRTFELPDNTVVRLDSDSAIMVAFTSHERRIDVVRGQAYFEVAKNPARPFRVRVGDALIDDIGTTFDIYRKPTGTVVTVVDGIVNVHREQEPASGAYLRAGEQGVISSSGAVKTERLDNVQRSIAWTRNEIVFEGEAVDSVVSEFNRYNNTQIVIADPRIAALTISGVFQTFDVRSFTQFLAELPNVRVIETDHTVTVTSAGEHSG